MVLMSAPGKKDQTFQLDQYKSVAVTHYNGYKYVSLRKKQANGQISIMNLTADEFGELQANSINIRSFVQSSKGAKG